MARTKRLPQINFQVIEPMKLLYDEAKASGHWVTRFCAAGFLWMVEDPDFRQRARKTRCEAALEVAGEASELSGGKKRQNALDPSDFAQQLLAHRR